MKLDATKKTEEEPTQAVAETNEESSLCQGQWRRADIQIPELKLVQPMSVFDEDFPNGAFIHDKTTLISKGLGERFEVFPLYIHKTYELHTPFGGEESPREWGTIEEPQGEGIPYGLGDGEFSEKGEVVFLVPIEEELAHYEFGGKFYVKTKYTFRKRNWEKAARIWTSGIRTGGKLYANRWEMSSKKITGRVATFYSALCFNKGAAEDKLVKWIEEETL